MPKISITIPDEVHAALQAQAARHGRQPATEAAVTLARQLRRAAAVEAVQQLNDPGVREDLAASEPTRVAARTRQAARIAALDGRADA